MANKLTRGILDLLENGEVSDLEVTDDDEDDLAFDGGDDFPGVELDDLLQQFDENLMDTADDTIVDTLDTNDIPVPSSDEEELLLLYAIAGSQQKRKRIWVHEINKKRENYGEYHRLCRKLESHEDRFYLYFRMSQDSFEELYQLFYQVLKK
ncbi:hypothetical protein QTP88_007063 [Uroleucon formosanum]